MIDALHDPVAELLDRLENVVDKGNNQWEARCPAHEDQRNSLCVSRGDDGRALLHCQANCKSDDIIASLKLTWPELMPPSNGHHANGHATKTVVAREIVATYDYRDEAGELLFQVVRYEPKDFRQRRPKRGGGWSWTVKGVRQVPYHLRELLAADSSRPVLICEGEKDVHALERMGFTASCNAGGAEKWKKDLNKHFKGRDVVIAPDNDKTGTEHAAKVARSLFGTAKSVRILNLPGLPPKGDVSDWLADGGTAERLEQLVSETNPLDGHRSIQPVKCSFRRSETNRAWEWYDAFHLYHPHNCKQSLYPKNH